MNVRLPRARMRVSSRTIQSTSSNSSTVTGSSRPFASSQVSASQLLLAAIVSWRSARSSRNRMCAIPDRQITFWSAMPCASSHFTRALALAFWNCCLPANSARRAASPAFSSPNNVSRPGGSSSATGGRSASGTSRSRSPTIVCTASSAGSTLGSRFARSG